jgi:carbon storage regulator
MLILSRKEGESIVIDGGIRIVVMQCAGGGVRLGIEAPSDVTILRGEIVHQIADENRRATAASGTASVVAKEWLPAPRGQVAGKA